MKSLLGRRETSPAFVLSSPAVSWVEPCLLVGPPVMSMYLLMELL